MKKILCLLACLIFLSSGSFCSELTSIEQYVYRHLYEGNSEVVLNFLHHLEEQGNAEGIYLLGVIYLEGYTEIKDVRLANYYFNKASALGSLSALKALADSYMAGDGVEKNQHTAFIIYKNAAMRGYGPAQFNVGIMLKNGHGTKVSMKEAYKYLDLAANNSDLGDMRKDAAYYRDHLPAS